MHDLNFEDLTPIERPVSIGQKKYILREASEGAACQYRNATLKGARMADGKIVGMDGVADAEPLLVSLCLHPVGPNDKIRLDTSGNPVPTDLRIIRAWPPRVVRALFDTLKEISPGLEEKEDQKALEKRFAETTEKLVALSESGRDRDAWREWLHQTVDEKLGTTPNQGPEDSLPNGQASGTTATSVSAAS